MSAADRFTFATGFGVRNVALATAVGVGVLGRVEFAVFTTLYFLTEVPVFLGAAVLFRKRRLASGLSVADKITEL